MVIQLTELLVSVKLLKSLTGCSAALRPRLARPLGVRESSSTVGEPHSLKRYVQVIIESR